MSVTSQDPDFQRFFFFLNLGDRAEVSVANCAIHSDGFKQNRNLVNNIRASTGSVETHMAGLEEAGGPVQAQLWVLLRHRHHRLYPG